MIPVYSSTCLHSTDCEIAVLLETHKIPNLFSPTVLYHEQYVTGGGWRVIIFFSHFCRVEKQSLLLSSSISVLARVDQIVVLCLVNSNLLLFIATIGIMAPRTKMILRTFTMTVPVQPII